MTFYVFVVVFSFAIGTLVGKTFTENQNKVGSLAHVKLGTAANPRLPASADPDFDLRVTQLFEKQRQEVLDLCRTIKAEKPEASSSSASEPQK